MLLRGWRRLFPLVIPLFVLAFITLKFHDEEWVKIPYTSPNTGTDRDLTFQPSPLKPGSGDASHKSTHREIFSLTSPGGRYFIIEFNPTGAINPNIIPHPILNDTWIIVGMAQKSAVRKTVWTAELVCNARFTPDKSRLQCLQPPIILPIGSTGGGESLCVDNLSFLSLNLGPHDARVFYGPKDPYAIYGSNSKHTCFGQWMSDFRTLVDWPLETGGDRTRFRQPTDLQRPGKYGKVEKNWFVFWDVDGTLHAHHDISPQRVFARLANNGTSGEDLAPLSRAHDDACMARFMPKLLEPPDSETSESIHQATNSLSITLCKRADPACVPSPDNTFIMTIFQHKRYVTWHSTYEPYVMLFAQSAPFAVHGISTKPLWIHGRGGPGTGMKPDSWHPWNGPFEGEEGFDPVEVQRKVDENRPWRNGPREDGWHWGGDKGWMETEMFYVTSFTWKQQGMKYHGFLDDVIFLGIGIEDSDTAGMDVLAGDLLQDIGLCADAPKDEKTVVPVDAKKGETAKEGEKEKEKEKEAKNKDGNPAPSTTPSVPDHDAHQGFKDPETN